MSSHYYLMAQLPSFIVSPGTTLPFSEEYFLELCSRFLDEKSTALLYSLSLEPPRKNAKTGSELVDTWYDWERNVRLALAQIRATKMKKDFIIAGDESGFGTDVLLTARTASGFTSPLEAEEFLNSERLAVLNRLTPLDPFSSDAVYAYALKFKLTLRIKKFNEESGMESYRKIYDTILGEST